MDYSGVKKTMDQPKKLFEVTFFTNQADSSHFIASISEKMQNNSESRNRSYFPHLSPNRSISEFRPFFEPNFNIEKSFKSIEQLISTEIDKTLSA